MRLIQYCIPVTTVNVAPDHLALLYIRYTMAIRYLCKHSHHYMICAVICAFYQLCVCICKLMLRVTSYDRVLWSMPFLIITLRPGLIMCVTLHVCICNILTNLPLTKPGLQWYIHTVNDRGRVWRCMCVCIHGLVGGCGCCGCACVWWAGWGVW